MMKGHFRVDQRYLIIYLILARDVPAAVLYPALQAVQLLFVSRALFRIWVASLLEGWTRREASTPDLRTVDVVVVVIFMLHSTVCNDPLCLCVGRS